MTLASVYTISAHTSTAITTIAGLTTKLHGISDALDLGSNFWFLKNGDYTVCLVQHKTKNTVKGGNAS